MSIGLESSFSILQRSPLDQAPIETPPGEGVPEAQPWVASRYNVQTRTEDGSLIVWNTQRGTISVFPPGQSQAVRSMLTKKGIEAPPEGIVKYLRDRGFLVKAGTDEYLLFQLAFGFQHYRADSLELTLLASEDCNFRCQYCYEQFRRGTMQPWVREGVKELVRHRLPSLRRLVIGWFGGEPLYGLPAIEELAPFFHQIAEENSIAFTSHMTTNGYLLTPEVAEKLLSWRVTQYQITIDGAPADHDCKRPARDGSGTFSQIFANLKSLRQRPENYTVDIRINFDHENHPHLEEFLALLGEEFGGDRRFRLRFRPVGRWGGANDSGLNVCGMDEATVVKNQLTEAARKQGIDSADNASQLNRLGTQVCYAARPYHFIIGSNGTVMKCTVDLDKEDRNVVGHLTQAGKLDLDAGKLALWTQPSFTSDPGCQKCVILPLCQGISCPLARIRSNQAPCPPLKTNLKNELIAAHKFKMPVARSVLVGGGAEGPSCDPQPV